MTDGVPDDWGFLKSNADLAEIAAAGAVAVETDGKAEYTYRVGHGFEFLYIVNVEREPAHIRVPRGFARADLLSLKTYRHPREFELQGGESILLLPGTGERVPRFKEEREIASEFRFAGAQDNALVLDTVRLREGVFPVHFTMRGLWDHGNCAMYDPAYRLRPFGAEHVRIAFEN